MLQVRKKCPPPNLNRHARALWVFLDTEKLHDEIQLQNNFRIFIDFIKQIGSINIDFNNKFVIPYADIKGLLQCKTFYHIIKVHEEYRVLCT